MSGLIAITPETLATQVENDLANKEAAFAAIRVAALLSTRLQTDAARVAKMEDALSILPDGALDDVAESALPAPDAVRAAILTIRACAAEPQLRPLVLAAMQEQAESRQLLAAGVLEVGVVVGVLLLIGKTEIRRDPNGKWEIYVHEINNAALVELAKFGTALLKKIPDWDSLG